MSITKEAGTLALILAGGSGTRMGSTRPKQELRIGALTVLERTVVAYSRAEKIDAVLLVVRADEVDFAREIAARYPKVIGVTVGGNTRAESALAGLSAADGAYRFIAVADAARCLILPGDIDKVVSAAETFGAASAVRAVFDTVKQVGPDGFIVGTIDRSSLVLAETPQVFPMADYGELLSAAVLHGEAPTDDNLLFEAAGRGPRPVILDGENFKITTKEDVALAENVLRKRGEL